MYLLPLSGDDDEDGVGGNEVGVGCDENDADDVDFWVVGETDKVDDVNDDKLDSLEEIFPDAESDCDETEDTLSLGMLELNIVSTGSLSHEVKKTDAKRKKQNNAAKNLFFNIDSPIQ